MPAAACTSHSRTGMDMQQQPQQTRRVPAVTQCVHCRRQHTHLAAASDRHPCRTPLCCPCCSRPQFDWLCREKIADGPLIAKWRKPGYEILCSMLAIQKGNHNFGTTSHCRVPLRLRASQVRDQQHGSACQHTQYAGGGCSCRHHAGRARATPVHQGLVLLLVVGSARPEAARDSIRHNCPAPPLRPCLHLQQRVTPDVQTGCISCASGDGKFGGPVWWNTPMDDADADAEGVEANRSTWGAPGGGAGGGGGGGGQQQQQGPGGSRKRPGEAFEDDDELPDEVRARLEALKRAG